MAVGPRSKLALAKQRQWVDGVVRMNTTLRRIASH